LISEDLNLNPGFELSNRRLKGIFIAVGLAGLSGAGGVILSAVASHLVVDERLQIAAGFLLLHACAVLALSGISVAIPRGHVWLWPAYVLLIGSILFGSDLALRAIAGSRLFPMAAPIGGTLLILGWFWVGVVGLALLWRNKGGKVSVKSEPGKTEH